MKLFLYAIVFEPKYDPMKKKDEQEEPKILKDVTSILAETQDQVVSIAGRDIPEEYMAPNRREEVRVVVRPF